jgi:hypothetical protein
MRIEIQYNPRAISYFRKTHPALQPYTPHQRNYNKLVKLYLKKLNTVALVRERTLPTERQPHVGEVSANACG